jgi:hypothetical protein
MACLNRNCDRPDTAPAAIPSKHQPPSLVDADRVQAVEMAPQLLEMVAGRRSQVAVRCRIVDHLYFAEQAIFQVGRDFLRHDVVDEELPQPVIPEAQDHAATPSEAMYHTMTHIAIANGGWYRSGVAVCYVI